MARPPSRRSVRESIAEPCMNRRLAKTCVLALLTGLVAQASSARGALVPDKNLEAALRAVLKHEPKAELTEEKLQNVYVLEAVGKDIRDLTGLEKCKNLALLR